MGCTQQITADWQPVLAAGGLRRLVELLDGAPDACGLTGRLELLSKPGLGGRQRWRWELGAGNGGAVLYLKRYARPAWREQWDRIVRQSPRHSRACWEFQAARHLAEAHIPAPPAVAFVQEMHGPLERRSAVVLGGVAGEAFDRVWSRACTAGAPITRGLARHDIAIRLGRFVAAFHGTGMCHRDLYLCHVFVDLDRAGRRSPTFALIDLARVHQPRWRRMRWVLKDLSQLDASARQIGASHTDRLRCLAAYLGLQRGSPRLRWYAARIVRRSARILARIERKRQSA